MSEQKSRRKLRWPLYVIAAAACGVINYHIHPVLNQGFGPNVMASPVWLALSGGLWLVPALLAALFEVRTGSMPRTVLAGAAGWVAAVIGYYLYYALRITLEGGDVGWAQNLQDMASWGALGAIGGALVGGLVAVIYKRRTNN